MDVLLLGAGRPARGDKPSALKNVALNTKALDWQIRSFEGIEETVRLHYLGGYLVEEVIRGYPQLNFTVIPDWDGQSIVHTLLQAPFSKHGALVTYTDTVFRKEIIEQLVKRSADVSFGVDSRWERRYQGRSQQDIDKAETVDLGAFGSTGRGQVEFTGLIYLKPPVVEYLSTVTESEVGTSLVDLLHHLRGRGYRVEPHEVDGHWAEFNSPADIAHFVLGTKAETLARLEPFVQRSRIGRQVNFTTEDWRQSPADQLAAVKSVFGSSALVVRSSAKAEDNWRTSNAGGSKSILDVDGNSNANIARAVDSVIESYGVRGTGDDQILVQEFVQNVRSAGVVLTCGLETGAPYYRFNFDDQTRSTESVTAGTHGDLRTIILSRSRPDALERVEPRLLPVLRAVQELEELLGFDKLDIEFAVGQQGQVHIFQVRPITVDHSAYEAEDNQCTISLNENLQYFRSQQTPSPFVFGARNVFGNMSDWNPAEIVGALPKPLALSLYQHLITNEVWATQRAEFGYRDVRPHPLIVTFSGRPYVDLRASLNSFIPAALSDEVAQTLASAYIRVLVDKPQLHDKIEFDVACTVWTPTFASEATETLTPYDVGRTAIDELGNALKVITRAAITRLEADTAPIAVLSARRQLVEESSMAPIDRVVALLDDCRRYGTPAFAHAARAGFVATAFLKSFVSSGVFSDARCNEFMMSVNTVASKFRNDKVAHAQGRLSQEKLVECYGHLRPGTYEISAQAYWEDPPLYLSCEGALSLRDPDPFALTNEEEQRIDQMLLELGAEQTPGQFVGYLQAAIQAREATKFEFTRSLSRALDACVELGNALGLTRAQMSFLEYGDLEQLRLNSATAHTLQERVARRRKTHAVMQLVQLPSLIVEEGDFHCFERPSSEPNFVTAKKIEARVMLLEGAQRDDLSGRILLIPQADPGFDWILGHSLAGLITKHGGANSHMAIRAAEMGLPAAIGVGDKLYEQTAQMRRLELDCANRVIREIP